MDIRFIEIESDKSTRRADGDSQKTVVGDPVPLVPGQAYYCFGPATRDQSWQVLILGIEANRLDTIHQAKHHATLEAIRRGWHGAVCVEHRRAIAPERLDGIRFFGADRDFQPDVVPEETVKSWVGVPADWRDELPDEWLWAATS